MMEHLKKMDPQVYKNIAGELERKRAGLEMIPSENFVSPAVLEALGSVMTDKYSEGYPGARYYGGCEFVDNIETLAQDRAKSLFNVSHANVQPYSGSPANQAVYFALLDPGDTVMGMALSSGGHLTHGLKANFSGRFYNAVQYGTDENGFIDYDAMLSLAREFKPKMIIIGATAYSRIYDWGRVREICDEINAFMFADISHIAGLIAGGAHPSPAGIADVITTTTHKTLRGPRGAIILCNGLPSNPLKKPERAKENLPSLIDRACFPGLQGGPHNHQTAAIAVALHEAAQPSFKQYAAQVVANAKALADGLLNRGFKIVTGHTDNHLILMDLTNKGVTGKLAEKALDKAGITVNKNTIPRDPRSPFDPSGIRLGTPAITTRGMKEAEMRLIAEFIDKVISAPDDESILTRVKNEVKELTNNFPLYTEYGTENFRQNNRI